MSAREDLGAGRSRRGSQHPVRAGAVQGDAGVIGDPVGRTCGLALRAAGIQSSGALKASICLLGGDRFERVRPEVEAWGVHDLLRPRCPLARVSH